MILRLLVEVCAWLSLVWLCCWLCSDKNARLLDEKHASRYAVPKERIGGASKLEYLPRDFWKSRHQLSGCQYSSFDGYYGINGKTLDSIWECRVEAFAGKLLVK